MPARLVPDKTSSGQVNGRTLALANPFSAVNEERFTVPKSVWEVKLNDLPLSTRLERVMGVVKAIRLGDLDGVHVGRLMNSKNCGKKTIAELVGLIEIVAAGEFKPILSQPHPGWHIELLMSKGERQFSLTRAASSK